MRTAGKAIVPIGFVVKWWEKGKAGTVGDMFWKIGEDGLRFWCDGCSLRQLEAMEISLTEIKGGWEEISSKLWRTGFQVPIYHPKKPMKCDECSLIIPVNLGQG